MKYLIDTQILIWFQLSSDKLSKKSIDLLLDVSNEILVSQVTLFELAIKQKIGKLPELDVPIEQVIALIRKDNFKVLNIHDKHISAYSQIPLLSDHRDPFDRLILATAFSENISIISADEKFRAYESIIQLLAN